MAFVEGTSRPFLLLAFDLRVRRLGVGFAEDPPLTTYIEKSLAQASLDSLLHKAQNTGRVYGGRKKDSICKTTGGGGSGPIGF